MNSLLVVIVSLQLQLMSLMSNIYVATSMLDYLEKVEDLIAEINNENEEYEGRFAQTYKQKEGTERLKRISHRDLQEMEVDE